GAHGGRVEVESVPGRTVFTVGLPAWDGTDADVATGAGADTGAETGACSDASTDMGATDTDTGTGMGAGSDSARGVRRNS
ncbi:hypothetical protein KDA82_17825, partial [Streptomyces daliensis]|nr:hypothetical protein [Streptomyces daliensis]